MVIDSERVIHLFIYHADVVAMKHMSDSIVLPIYKSSVNRCRLYSFWKFVFSMREYVYRGPPLVVFLLTRAGAIGEKRILERIESCVWWISS
jgi:hypothetical protein